MTPKIPMIGMWVTVALLVGTMLVIGIDLVREQRQLHTTNDRLELLEEEAFAFPGSATWMWRQHIDEAIGRVEAAVQLGLQALRVPLATPTRPKTLRSTPTRLRRTPTFSPDATIITTPFLIGVAQEVLRGLERDHPTWPIALKRRYATAALAQYFSAHGGIPSAVTVNRLLDEAISQMHALPTPSEEKKR